MAIVTLDTLKGYFNDGDLPIESNYADLIDSLSNSPGNVISSYLSLMGLRAFWPFTSINDVDQVMDLSSQGRRITGVSPAIRYDDGISAFPFASFNVGRYYYRDDESGLDLTGGDTIFPLAAQKGMTCGCWVRVSETPVPGSDLGIISKYNGVGSQKSFLLYRQGVNNRLTFIISGDGAGVNAIASPIDYVINEWNFVVGRFNCGNSISIFHNGSWDSNVTSIPSTIYNSTARVELGSFSGGGATWVHQGTLYFLAATALSNTIIEKLFAATRGLFGV